MAKILRHEFRKPPYFKFNVADYLTSVHVLMMTSEQRGWYIMMLANQWNSANCLLVNDAEAILLYAGINSGNSDEVGRFDRTGQAVLKRFETTPDGKYIFNPRLMVEYEEVLAFRLECSRAGKKSRRAAKANKDNGMQTQGTLKVPSTDLQGTCNQTKTIDIDIDIDKRQEAREEQQGSLSLACDSAAERFWAKVRKTENCWEWTASVNPDGYGFVRINGIGRNAHRVAWELENGAVPEGMHVCHRCDNPSCVRPEHLFLGTRSDNMRDSVAKGRKSKQFTTPTVDEVSRYCQDRRNRVDPNKWHDYYVANGWKVGKVSMKDWKASVRYWERSGIGGNGNGQANKAEARQTGNRKAIFDGFGLDPSRATGQGGSNHQDELATGGGSVLEGELLTLPRRTD